MNDGERKLSLRIDAIQRAIDTATGWEDSATKRAALRVLRRRMRRLHGQVPT